MALNCNVVFPLANLNFSQMRSPSVNAGRFPKSIAPSAANGEEFVLEVERQKLAKAERPDLVRRIRWVAVTTSCRSIRAARNVS
jgi:hypothetical protein